MINTGCYGKKKQLWLWIFFYRWKIKKTITRMVEQHASDLCYTKTLHCANTYILCVWSVCNQNRNKMRSLKVNCVHLLGLVYILRLQLCWNSSTNWSLIWDLEPVRIHLSSLRYIVANSLEIKKRQQQHILVICTIKSKTIFVARRQRKRAPKTSQTLCKRFHSSLQCGTFNRCTRRKFDSRPFCLRAQW